LRKRKHHLRGEKKKIEEILNTEILVIGYRIGKSKYKDRNYLTLEFENGGGKYIVFSLGKANKTPRTIQYGNEIGKSFIDVC